MTGELEIPENLSEWTKGGIVEHIGSDEEHTDTFYRHGNLGAEQDKDGTWGAYTIVDGHPIKVKGDMMSFAEVVEFFKGSFCSKRLSDGEEEDDDDDDDDNDVPDVDEEPEFPSDGEMGITIMLKSITEMMSPDYDGDCVIRKSNTHGDRRNYGHPWQRYGAQSTKTKAIPNKGTSVGRTSREYNKNQKEGKTSRKENKELTMDQLLAKYYNKFNNPGIAKLIRGLGPNDNLDMAKHKIPVVEDEYGMLIPKYPESYEGPRLPILHDRMTPQQLRWATMAYGGNPLDKYPTLLRRLAPFPYRVDIGRFANNNLQTYLNKTMKEGINLNDLKAQYGRASYDSDKYPKRPPQEQLGIMLNDNPDNDRVTALYRMLAPREGDIGAVGNILQAEREYTDPETGEVKKEVYNLLNPGALLSATEEMLDRELKGTKGMKWIQGNNSPHPGAMVPSDELYKDFIAEMMTTDGEKGHPKDKMKEYLSTAASHDIMGFKNPLYSKITAHRDPLTVPQKETAMSMEDKMKLAEGDLPIRFQKTTPPQYAPADIKERDVDIDGLGTDLLEKENEYTDGSENPLMKSISDMISEKHGACYTTPPEEYEMEILNENPRSIIIGAGKMAIPDPQHVVEQDIYRTYSMKDFPKNFPGKD